MSWNIVEVKDTLALYLVLFALAVIILGYLSNHVFLTVPQIAALYMNIDVTFMYSKAYSLPPSVLLVFCARSPCSPL